jgi:DNA-dependent protein kinase catalytic subunit
MTDRFSIVIVYQWLDTLIASLDCYTWIFSQGYLTPLVFIDTSSRLLIALNYFISHLSMRSLSELVLDFSGSNSTQVILTPTDINQFQM